MMINNENYTEQAEKIIKDLKGFKKDGELFTTSQIRNLLSIAITISNKIDYSQEELTEENLYGIRNLYMKFIYQSGKEKNIKRLYEKAKFQELFDKLMKDKKSKDYKLFIDFLEALVAWHKFYGGRA